MAPVSWDGPFSCKLIFSMTNILIVVLETSMRLPFLFNGYNDDVPVGRRTKKEEVKDRRRRGGKPGTRREDGNWETVWNSLIHCLTIIQALLCLHHVLYAHEHLQQFDWIYVIMGTSMRSHTCFSPYSLLSLSWCACWEWAFDVHLYL